MFNFSFTDLSLNLLLHMKNCRFGFVIIKIQTKNKLAEKTTNTSIVSEIIFCTDFFST